MKLTEEEIKQRDEILKELDDYIINNKEDQSSFNYSYITNFLISKIVKSKNEIENLKNDVKDLRNSM